MEQEGRRKERRKTRSLKRKIVRNVSQAWHGIGGFLSTSVRIITRHKNWQRQEIKKLGTRPLVPLRNEWLHIEVSSVLNRAV